MRIILIGVPGSGKSTAMQILKRINAQVKIYNFGDFMFKEAMKRYNIKDRDEMRKKLDLEKYRELQLLAARELAMEIDKEGGEVIIDTHAAIKTADGYYPGLPTEVARELKPDAIVLIEYDPEVIIERRLIDMKIKTEEAERGIVRTPRARRDVEGLDEVELHQLMNRHLAASAANTAACPIKIINLRGVPQSRPFEHAEMVAKAIAGMISRRKA